MIIDPVKRPFPQMYVYTHKNRPELSARTTIRDDETMCVLGFVFYQQVTMRTWGKTPLKVI